MRDYDVFSGKHDLERLYVMKHFPVYMGVSDQRQEEDLFADMEWMISRGSGMIQLLRLVPDHILYKNSHNGSIGEIWKEHHGELAELIYKYTGNNMPVLELGGGNGVLNALYAKKYGNSIKWTIVEPSTVEPVKGCYAEYIRKIWDCSFSDTKLQSETGCLVHSHVIEHLFDLESFMEQNEQMLANGQKMIFSVPNLKETLKRKYTNALNFEHTYYISEDYVDACLRRHAFSVIEKKYFKADHSIFYVTEKKEQAENVTDIDFSHLYTENKKIFMEYVKYYEELIRDLNDRMAKEERPVYLFGAHIFSQYLIYFGLNTANIRYILDNDKRKQGKRLYGTSLSVRSPEILAGEKRPVVILRAANYTDEIKTGILEHMNAETVFW